MNSIFVYVERGSKEFERFLTILGNKIRLKGWDKYRGGLDVKGKQWKCPSGNGFFLVAIELRGVAKRERKNT